MRFLIHPQSLLDDWQEMYCAYIGGRDGKVFPTSIMLEENVLNCTRQTTESGKLYVSYPVEGFGRPMLSTSSLREREPEVDKEQPYILSLELARGMIGQVRNQISAWEVAKKEICEEAKKECLTAQNHFAFAASHQDDLDECCRAAELALQHACIAAELLVGNCAEHEISVIQKKTHHPLALLSGNMGNALPEEEWGNHFRKVFHQANIPLLWKNIESEQGEQNWDITDAQVDWCLQHRLLMRGGPLLDFSPCGLPEWLENWQTDLSNVQSFICDYVESAISRYYGKIRTWEICARSNTGGALGLSEEIRLSLVAHTLEIARRVDEEIQLVISINQPWGEYQARGIHHLSPLQFVDALLRSGVGLTAVNLEFSIGYQPCGSANRDLLEFSRMLDLWSCLGIPLHITLAVPSSDQTDPLAHDDLEVNNNQWQTGWTEESQTEWIKKYLPLLMASPLVVSVEWSHLSDALPHHFPHAGLLRADGSPKPAYDFLVDYKNKE